MVDILKVLKKKSGEFINFSLVHKIISLLLFITNKY